MSSTSIGWTIIIVGLAIVAIGILFAIGALSWFGRLPGDIRIEGDSVRVFVPITSMLLISVILTLAVNILRRLLR
jgi:hypothetical protein